MNDCLLLLHEFTTLLSTIYNLLHQNCGIKVYNPKLFGYVRALALGGVNTTQLLFYNLRASPMVQNTLYNRE